MSIKLHDLWQVWVAGLLGVGMPVEVDLFIGLQPERCDYELNLTKIAWTEGGAGDFAHVFPFVIVWCSQHGVMWRRTLQPSKCGGQNACLVVAWARSTTRLELLRDNGPT